MDYKDTLNLPKTDFPMRADLAKKEPLFIERWQNRELYQKMLAVREGEPRFLLHDGPPYANGNIHIGHVLNKVLKDFVLKYKTMAGFRCEYVPGWDCHGLPIELQVDRELGKDKQDISVGDFRRRCRGYAHRFVEVQRDEFQRLGILGEWAAPYLTMDYRYEAAIARELGKVVEAGELYRGKKPVYWCASCKTALAEAEVEYEMHTSPSIYVGFPMPDPPPELQRMAGGKPIEVAIWTTTPWTIPANLAIAMHPEATYCLLDLGDRAVVVAEVLADFVAKAAGRDEVVILGKFQADLLANRVARHPLYARDSVLLTASFVTMDTGTGCVHVAPGHGADDYELGKAHGLDAYAPVDDRGCYTAEVPEWQGIPVFKANPQVVERLQQVGALLNRPGETVEHTYPHCWRCKKPIVFRATEQWFISMEAAKLREKALAAIQEVRFIPKWGRERIRGMLENRPDWCVSRQRTWGVPIPAFYCLGCGQVLLTKAITDHVASLFNAHGADIWFEKDPAELVPPGTSCPSCQGTEFRTEKDILDVWWDSGVSWAAVIEDRMGGAIPCDLYLEGSDQHRGWFQSSLLAAISTRGKAPYRTVLTHGFTMDGLGRKMSKSLGNVVRPDSVIKKSGAEILRLWVAAEDYRGDVRVSNEILTRLTEAYRKIRNTLRFLLGNIHDFDPNQDQVDPAEMSDLDRWALGRCQLYLEKVQRAYEQYEFHQIYHATVDFCATHLSAFYLDILKDRLYASGTISKDRRSAQTVLWTVAHTMTRALAPVMAFTAEEVWDHIPKLADDLDSVHLARFPEARMELVEPQRQERYARMEEIRTVVLKALEEARRQKVIGGSLEASIQLCATPEVAAFLGTFGKEELEDIFIVSQVQVVESQAAEVVVVASDGAPDGVHQGIAHSTATVAVANGEGAEAHSETVTAAAGAPVVVQVGKSDKIKCERCWKVVVEPDRVQGEASGDICDRCREVLAG